MTLSVASARPQAEGSEGPEDDGPNRPVPRAVLPHVALHVAVPPPLPPAPTAPGLGPTLAPAAVTAERPGAAGAEGSEGGVGTPAAGSAGQASSGSNVVVNDSEIVLGTPIQDNGTGKVVRRVVILATIGASFYICNFNVNLMRGSFSQENQEVTLWTAMSELLIELSIPACGYCGALYNNRQLTCCFCSCNLFITIITIITFVRLNIRISELDGDCGKEADLQQRRRCEVWMSNGPDKWVMLGSTILIICLGCLAFWFGNSLYNRLSQETSAVPPPVPVVGEVISLGGPGQGASAESSSGGAAATAGDAGSFGAPTLTSSSDGTPIASAAAPQTAGSPSAIVSASSGRGGAAAEQAEQGTASSANARDRHRQRSASPIAGPTSAGGTPRARPALGDSPLE